MGPFTVTDTAVTLIIPGDCRTDRHSVAAGDDQCDRGLSLTHMNITD